MYCCSRNSGVNGALRRNSRLSSSNPDSRCIFVRSSTIMFTQLVTMASVTAISRMISRTRVRLWVIARKIGPSGMRSPLLQLQLQSRRQRADAPGGIDTGHEPGDERQENGRQNHPTVDLHRDVSRQHFRQKSQDSERQEHSGCAADDADNLALDDVLQKDLSATRAECSAHGNLRGASEKL